MNDMNKQNVFLEQEVSLKENREGNAFLNMWLDAI